MNSITALQTCPTVTIRIFCPGYQLIKRAKYILGVIFQYFEQKTPLVEASWNEIIEYMYINFNIH